MLWISQKTWRLMFSAFVLTTAAASAATIHDAAGDFLPTYTGAQNNDLDVLSAEVFYNGKTFRFTSTSAGNIGTTPGGIFVWGIDRGAGTSRFPIVAPGVLFDSVLVINPLGQSTVRDLITGVATPLAGSSVMFAGGFLSATVDAALLPSWGFDPGSFTVNLWPRVGLGNDNQISDFAPNNSNASVTATPEPGNALMLFSGMALLVGLARAKRGR